MCAGGGESKEAETMDTSELGGAVHVVDLEYEGEKYTGKVHSAQRQVPHGKGKLTGNDGSVYEGE